MSSESKGRRLFLLAVLVVAGLSIAVMQISFAQYGPAGEGRGIEQAGQALKKLRHITHAVCVIHPTEGHTAKGVVRFTANGDKVHIVAEIQGLSPNAKHGFHIHQYGDCSALDGKSAGGHYNPTGTPHGLPPAAERHAGDLGNLQADAHGTAHYELTVDNIMIAGPHNPVLGRAIIIHGKEDDGGQPTGNAGPRIGCGVIGIAKKP